MAEAKLDRNREIYEARLAGETFTKLAEKYGITPNCVSTIFKREQREELKHHKYYQILSSLTDNEEMITRTIHVLERNNLDSNEAILGTTRKELLKCRNCGEVMIDLILKVAAILHEEK